MTWAQFTSEFLVFYGDTLRSSLFTGFLSVGGFLLAVKTFVVIRMKEGMYDQEFYIQEILGRARDLDQDVSHYAPLRNLSSFLFAAILSSLVTSGMQLTVGFVPHWVAAAACTLAAVVSFVLLVISLFLVRANLNDWFDALEKDSKKEIRRHL